jgi:phosphoribosylformimino-5-aminoimidazole carboxamide ribotide isomerase
VNQEAVLAIRRTVSIKLELGGGIRTLDTIDFYLGQGLNRIILGTAAHQDPDLVSDAARRYPGRIAIGIDARHGRVMVNGWTRDGGVAELDLARQFEDLGIAALIYTDIERDGMQTGPNIERTRALAKAVRIPVIASGGVKDLDDIRALKPLEADGVAGVISGKALYEGTLDFAEAKALAAS